MSYNSKNFSVMAYANGFTLWNYSTPDTLATVTGSGYLNEIAPFARIGDMIMVNASIDGSLEPAILAVTANTGEEVSVSTLGSAAIGG